MRIETLLKQLIRFQTVTDDTEANADALAWVKKRVGKLPLTIREFKFNKHPSLVMTTKQTKRPKVLLQAHIDVVPGSPQMFVPRTDKNRLYGRGAFDMKFAIATYIELLLDLGNELKKYDFGIMLTSDEETGGRDGVKSLVQEKGYRTNVVFLPDGGENWKFERSSKGILRMLIKSHGRAAHGAYPWLGLDANTQLASYITDIRKKFDKLETHDQNRLYPTLTVGVMNGGDTVNQVPEYAEAKLDIRIPHGYPGERINRIISSARNKYPHISVHKISHTQGFKANTSERYRTLFSDIVQETHGHKPGEIDAHGSSDAKYFRKLGIPVILIRPRGGRQHSEKEWVDLRELDTYYQCLREFVNQEALL